MKNKKKYWFILGIFLFLSYFLIAARPIPKETVLIPRWLNSIETGSLISFDNPENEDINLIPFELGGRFGYINNNGHFLANRIKKNNIAFSKEYWAEYEQEPDQITVYTPAGETLTVIKNPEGYPFFLDGRIFIINSERNAISQIDSTGSVSWRHEFAGIITCVDAAAGLLLAGTLDGVISLLDNNGKQIFSFAPGGSRYALIAGCAISRDGNAIAVISGIDNQCFLFLRCAKSGGDYNVVYREFLEKGFRREVDITFIEDDQWVLFEREGGLGFYQTDSRKIEKLLFNGTVDFIENNGSKEQVFIIISPEEDKKELIGIKLPNKIVIKSSFKSGVSFLDRIDSRIIVGGGQSLIAFDIDDR